MPEHGDIGCGIGEGIGRVGHDNSRSRAAAMSMCSQPTENDDITFKLPPGLLMTSAVILLVGHGMRASV